MGVSDAVVIIHFMRETDSNPVRGIQVSPANEVVSAEAVAEKHRQGHRTKKCRTCRTEKPTTHFYREKQGRLGVLMDERSLELQRRWRRLASLVCSILILGCAFAVYPQGAKAKEPPPVPSSNAPHSSPAYRAYVVCVVFGPAQCHRAVTVAWCENSLSPWSPRGAAHAGLFQVSFGLRREYRGFGRGAWKQARHALRVFNASGRNWMTHWRWSVACWGRM